MGWSAEPEVDRDLNEQGGDRELRSFWDARLAERGAQLIYDRIHAVQELDVIAWRIHHTA